MIDRVFDNAGEWAQRYRPHQKAQRRAAQKEKRRGQDCSEDQTGALDMPDQHR
jgi:hypothetical protein